MPTYVFRCPDCEVEEEVTMPISALEAKVVLCSVCGKAMPIAFQPFGLVVSDKPAKKQLTGWRKRLF